MWEEMKTAINNGIESDYYFGQHEEDPTLVGIFKTGS
jgi:hypothetical protein